MPTLRGMPQLQLIHPAGDCGVCLSEEKKPVYTHGGHTADSAICQACAERLNPAICPFCRADLTIGERKVEPLTKAFLEMSKDDILYQILLAYLATLTLSCKPTFDFYYKKEDRDPPSGGCGDLVISQELSQQLPMIQAY